MYYCCIVVYNLKDQIYPNPNPLSVIYFKIPFLLSLTSQQSDTWTDEAQNP
jgi:hypothetical protein